MAVREAIARAVAILERVDRALFQETECFFAGGTAISLRCGEFRWSDDIDFLCASGEGYRQLRSRVFYAGAQGLFSEPVALAREARCDRYGIRLAIFVEDTPVKFEIVNEGRILLAGVDDPALPVARLQDVDLVAENLLANADRFLDDGSLGRDAIDLLMLEEVLGHLPDEAFQKARKAYGQSIDDSWQRAFARMQAHPERLQHWLTTLDVTAPAQKLIQARLAALPLSPADPDNSKE